MTTNTENATYGSVNDKVRVFTGPLERCYEFARANRFNKLLSDMEIRDGGVYARRWGDAQPNSASTEFD